MTKNLYVDVHILQDVPPANLNRDDNGSPKSARYGGVDRLRGSSQSFKRATRKYFETLVEPSTLGQRTRRMIGTLKSALETAGISNELAEPLAIELLAQIGIKAGKKADESAYLFFFSRPQLEKIAEEAAGLAGEINDTKKIASQIDVKSILGSAHSLDVALFGRMVADMAEINVDAAAQVSHALATHSSPNQADFFTAVDDAQDDNETGAGMIGTIEFNSATLYRYATICVPALIENMTDEEAAVAGVGHFIRAFSLALPTGHQNSFAAHSRPSLVWVQVRQDQPVNYMSAFEKPVTSGRDGGYMARSINALASFVTAETARWGDQALLSICSRAETTAQADLDAAFGSNVSFDSLLAKVDETLQGALGR